MAKQGPRVWAKMESVVWGKINPLPIHKFLTNFHLLSLYGSRVFCSAGGPTGLC